MINFHIALKPHCENALIDALLEVSQPTGSTQSTSSSLLLTTLLEAYSCVCVLLLRFRYGAYPSKGRVAELVASHTDTLELFS